MVTSAAPEVEQYIASLPEDRREPIRRVRDIVNANLPPGFEEGMQYGMIGWYVPLVRYPDTYNGQPLAIANLGSQKNHMALYLTSVYGDPVLDKWFRDAFAAAGKKLDMGKSCVRFRSLDALPLDVIGQTISKVGLEAFLARYEEVRAETKTGKPISASARGVRAALDAEKPRTSPAKLEPKQPAASAKLAAKTPAKRTR